MDGVSRRGTARWLEIKRAGVDAGVDAYGRLSSRQKVVESLVVRVSKGYLLLVAGARPVSDIEVAPPPPPPLLETRNEIQSLTTTDLHTFPGSKAAAAAATVNA